LIKKIDNNAEVTNYASDIFSPDCNISNSSIQSTSTDYSWEQFENEIFDSESTREVADPVSIRTRLEDLSLRDRVASNTNIIDYWNFSKLLDPEVGQLAEIALAVPATQVSVERAFSGLALVLSPNRTSLSAANMENILLSKLNKELFDNLNLDF
jgi:hypothetical protein